jgi:hypothetical protein
VLNSLPRVLRTTEEEGVSTSRLAERKLVEGEALSTGLLDASAGGAGEAERGDRELGDVEEADVVGDGGDCGRGEERGKVVSKSSFNPTNPSVLPTANSERTAKVGGERTARRTGNDGVLLREGLVALANLTGNARDRHGGTVDLAHVEAAEDDLVEARVGATGEEAVKLFGWRVGQRRWLEEGEVEV